VRTMAQDERIEQDQRFAWTRWSTDQNLPSKP
jgi:hypothetical protein